jgi:prepilin-type N-terminal cleavage/methylation domain-containing protein
MHWLKKNSDNVDVVSRLAGYPVSPLQEDKQTGNRQTGKQANRQTKKGFTLIEMLLVTTMVAVISLAVYATFNSGIKIWQRVNKQIAEEDINIFFDKFASDLRNTFKFSGINFSGKEDEVEFATIVNSPRLHIQTVGMSLYSYDSRAKALKREQMDFSQLCNHEANPAQVLLKEVTALKFSYYFFDKDAKQYIWGKEWDRDGLPLAVRIELSVGPDEKEKAKKFVRTINIPVKG